MNEMVSHLRRQDSLVFSRRRDAQLRWLLETHPVTAAILVNLKWFPGKDTALRRLDRLVSRGKILYIGAIQRKRGRPEKVYSRKRFKSNQLLHEVEITEVCAAIRPRMVQRGPSIADHPLRPDAVLWINAELVYLELDRASMGDEQITQRLRQYDGCGRVVLWVCPTEKRVEHLRKLAATADHTPLFATFAEATTCPHDPVWRHPKGGRLALPRQQVMTSVATPAVHPAVEEGRGAVEASPDL